MRDAYLSALYDLARQDERIFALVADNGAIVYDKYRRDFGSRFINFGIAEANMVSVAAGLASCGKIPFAYTISSFLTMRAFEQIRNDVCMQKMNVKLVGIGSGFVYSSLGPTHHATEDIALMSALPFMTILSPADDLESHKATFAAAKIDGPVYLRLATGSSPAVYAQDYDFEVGKGVVLKEGSDIAIIATGGIVSDVLPAEKDLAKLGISARVINIHTIKPIDSGIIVQAARETGAILTVEEHSINNGLGAVIAAVLLENNAAAISFKRMGLNDKFAQGYGTYKEMKEMNGLSKEDIVKEAKCLYESREQARNKFKIAGGYV